MTRFARIYILAIIFLTTGCAEVRTSVTTFYTSDHLARGPIVGVPLDAQQANSLEFGHARDILYNKLSEIGYAPNPSGAGSQFAFFVTYGVDSGRTATSAVPIFGQTGGSTSYSSGTISHGGMPSASYSGTTTTMPTYGIIGAIPVSNRVFTRHVNIDIYKLSDPPQKIYEIRAVSAGTCANISAVLPLIVDGIFKNFPPPKNGTPVTVDVPADDLRGKC